MAQQRDTTASPPRRIGLWVLLSITVALAVAVFYAQYGDHSVHLWYYDMNTGILFPGPSDTAPPIAAPSGPYTGSDTESFGPEAGVAAMVVQLKDGGQRQTVYLQRFTAKSRALRERQLQGEVLGSEGEDAVTGGLLVALPPSKPGQPAVWYTTGSKAGKAILARYDDLVGSGQAHVVLPE